MCGGESAERELLLTNKYARVNFKHSLKTIEKAQQLTMANVFVLLNEGPFRGFRVEENALHRVSWSFQNTKLTNE